MHASQTVQVEALTTAYVNWRRRWMGPGRYALGGALVWQLNDCWPVISWAICDYYLRPKAAYYAVRRALAPIALGLARAEHSAAVWAMNGALATRSLSLELRAINLDGSVVARELRRVTLAPNAATELGTFDAQADVIAARLLDGEAVVARFALWPEPLKYVTLPDPGLTVTRTPAQRRRIAPAGRCAPGQSRGARRRTGCRAERQRRRPDAGRSAGSRRSAGGGRADWRALAGQARRQRELMLNTTSRAGPVTLPAASWQVCSAGGAPSQAISSLMRR